MQQAKNLADNSYLELAWIQKHNNPSWNFTQKNIRNDEMIVFDGCY